MTDIRRTTDDIGREFETHIIRMSKQQYNLKAGLEYDRTLMESESESLLKLSKEFLDSYLEPRSFYLNCINTIAQSRKLPISLEIYEKRNAEISYNKYNFAGKPVNWGSWRQFNTLSRDIKERKEIFDFFIEKASQLSSLISTRFNIAQQVYSLYGTSPLDAYLEIEKTSYEKLTNFVGSLGDNARKSFLSAADHFAPEVFDKETLEYYDDFYVARGRIYTPLNKYLEKKNPLKIIEKVLSEWGFQEDLTKIRVDHENREKKSPSAFCFGIQIPNDVRIVFKRVSPFSDFTSLFHEFGHGIHATSGIAEDPYWKRYLVPMSVAETFSILIEMLLQYKPFLQEELELSDEAILEILDRRHFMNLYFLVFYAANSLFKLEYWKNNYSLEQAESRYQELTKRFFIELPGKYWLLHHIMPEYDLYSPSYMIASIRVKELMQQLIGEYGEFFWKEKRAGSVVKDLAASRADFDLTIWNMDIEPYLEEQSEFSFF